MSGGVRDLSLLPFLERNPGAFPLRFPLASEDPEAIAHSSFPFLLVSDSDPVARIVAARIESDGGDRVASLFLLVQKDRYRIGKETLHPVTNPDVERAWQRAGAAYRGAGEGRSPRFFGGQLGENGILSPFRSLFFCKETGRYFHPPCPRCGRPLSLCADDGVLGAAGLPLYSNSLERHLFCEPCGGPPGGNFYAYETGSGSPASLRDRITLVREFGRVREGASPETGFPCPACPDREACYGPSLKALVRIVPFSFYPFHAFAFEEMTLCAPDFLALLSGATAEPLAIRLESAGERGRAACVRAAADRSSPLLFERGERRFLEILYLKLSLLGELFDSLPAGGRLPGPPEFRPSVDRAWVVLGAARHLLPRYWNFRVNVLDIGRYAEEDAPRPEAPGREDLSRLGATWFDALLINGKQDGTAVRAALSERLRRPPPGDVPPFPGSRDPGSPFFAGNLFFEPSAVPLSEGAAELWDGALAAGWTILLAGAGNGTGDRREAILGEIRILRARVRDRLFAETTPTIAAGEAPAPEPEPPVSGRDADTAIAGILDAILLKWSAAAPPADAPAPPPAKEGPARPRTAPPEEDDFMVRTVVLGAHPGAPPPSGAPRIAADPAPAPPDPAKTPAPPPGTIGEADDAMEKTVMLRPGDLVPGPPRTGPPRGAPPPAADDLEKTVILGPGKSGAVPPTERTKAAKDRESPPPAPGPEEGIDLEKTVILKPPPDGGKIRRQGR